MSRAFSDWENMLQTISKIDVKEHPEFIISAAERGMIFTLLANPPEELTEPQVAKLTGLKSRYEASVGKQSPD